MTTYSISATTSGDISGALSGVSVTTVDTGVLVKNRKNTELLVTFTITTALPETGSILIKFPTGVTPDPHCRSAQSANSKLADGTGVIACELQGNAWYITNFAALAASNEIVIYGTATLPSTAGATGEFEIYTYGNQDSDILTNGEVLDKELTAGTLTIGTTATMSIDTTLTSYPQQIIRAAASNYHPLTFDFTTQVAGGITSPNTIQIRVPLTGFSNSLLNGGTLYCYFIRLTDYTNLPCSIVTLTVPSYLEYALTPSVTLAAGTAYRGVITTKWATNGNDGILFPSTAGVYEIVYIAASTEKTSYPLEVYPAAFESVAFNAYIFEMGAENLIDVYLKVSTAIPTNEVIVVEIPVVQNGTNLFANDLGTGLYDQQSIACDNILTNPAATCKLIYSFLFF